MWLFMIYHRPFKLLLKYRDKIWFRHRGADLEENRAETPVWLGVNTRVHIYFRMNSILYCTFTEKDQAGSIFKAPAQD